MDFKIEYLNEFSIEENFKKRRVNDVWVSVNSEITKLDIKGVTPARMKSAIAKGTIHEEPLLKKYFLKFFNKLPSNRREKTLFNEMCLKNECKFINFNKKRCIKFGISKKDIDTNYYVHPIKEAGHRLSKHTPCPHTRNLDLLRGY